MDASSAVAPAQPDITALLQRLCIHGLCEEEQKNWIKDRVNIDAAAPPLTKPERALLQTYARGDDAQKKPKPQPKPKPDDPNPGPPKKPVDLARASRWLTKAASTALISPCSFAKR